MEWTQLLVLHIASDMQHVRTSCTCTKVEEEWTAQVACTRSMPWWTKEQEAIHACKHGNGTVGHAREGNLKSQSLHQHHHTNRRLPKIRHMTQVQSIANVAISKRRMHSMDSLCSCILIDKRFLVVHKRKFRPNRPNMNCAAPLVTKQT